MVDTFFLANNGKNNVDLIMAELGNRDKADRLAVLFKDINGMNNRALARNEKSSMISNLAWTGSTFREKYSHLKRAGAVASYMLDTDISKMFVETSNGVYDVLGKIDAGNKWNLQPRYVLWIDHLISAYNDGMKFFIKTRSQDLLDDHLINPTKTGFTASECYNLQRMARTGNPNFNMWWARKFRNLLLCSTTMRGIR